MDEFEHPSLEDLTLYALGGDDPVEHAALTAHLGECRACRHALTQLLPAVDALADTVPEVSPPSDLRDRVLAASLGDAHAPLRPARRPRWFIGWSVALLAVALLVVTQVHMRARLDASQAVVKRQRTVVQVLADPASVSMVVQNRQLMAHAWARVFLKGSVAVMVMHRVPAAPPGQAYDIWWMRGNAAYKAGQWTGRRDSNMLVLSSPWHGFTAVGVTLQSGGDQLPSGPILMMGERPTTG